MSAFTWSAVMTRGLETILPLPSASSADSSRFRKRLAAEPNSDSAKVAALAPPRLLALAGRFTNCELVKSIGPERWPVCTPMAS